MEGKPPSNLQTHRPMTTEFYTTQEQIEEEIRMLDTYCFNADRDLTDIQIMDIAEEAFDADAAGITHPG